MGSQGQGSGPPRPAAGLRRAWGGSEAELCWPLRAYQPTVDGDALLGPLARGPCPLQPLGAGQVHKVKLGSECLVLTRRRGAIRKPAHGLVHLWGSQPAWAPLLPAPALGPQGQRGWGCLAHTEHQTECTACFSRIERKASLQAAG